ncbi:chromosome segregation protein Csm1/Pcs1 domain-containing protein [Trichoderma ceciliae]
MRDRPAAANRVTKQTRNGSRRANAKATSTASTSSKRARKVKSEVNDIAIPPDSSIASGVDEDISALDQSKSSKPTRGRPKASKGRNSINSSNEQATIHNAGDAEEKGGSNDQDSDEHDIRRQLSELKQSYWKLETRYQDLQELGVKKAEQNFEQLKAQADENTRVANELIAQLKEEIVEQSKSIRRAEQLQSQLGLSEAEVDALRGQLLEANQSLSQAKSEMKTLYSKLAASRHTEPNSKGPATGNRMTPENKKQIAQVKEDLYADLTGLIVRDVRHIDKEDVFDCIQTGRNGTLHFKLGLEDMDATDSYENAQFTYRPQLDSSRDGGLIEVLPDYLTEEIIFPRHQASKFYTRVIKSLMERLD